MDKREILAFHVVIKGFKDAWIFQYEKDKQLVLDKFDNVGCKFDIRFYAYCIMDNHVHLVVKCTPAVLSSFLRSFNNSFAKSYNYNLNRKGQVLDYKPFIAPIYDKISLQKEIFYTHKNPFTAKVINPLTSKPFNSLDQYPWSSFLAIINYLNSVFTPDINDLIDYVSLCKLYGSNRMIAEKRFLYYHQNLELSQSFIQSLLFDDLTDSDELSLTLKIVQKFLKGKISACRRFQLSPFDQSTFLQYLNFLKVKARHQLIRDVKYSTNLSSPILGEIFLCSVQAINYALKLKSPEC